MLRSIYYDQIICIFRKMRICIFMHNYIYFIKPFNRGQILQSGRGVNSILITILRFDHLPEKIELFPFSLTASFSACREIHLRKVIFRLNLVKLGSEILNLFLAEKWSFVYSLFCYNTLRKKLFDVRLGNCSTTSIIRYIIYILIFCRFTGFTKITSRWKVRFRTFFKMIYKKCFISWCWSQTLSIILGGFTALLYSSGSNKRLIYIILSFSGLGGLRASSLEAPGLHDTNLKHTQDRRVVCK